MKLVMRAYTFDRGVTTMQSMFYASEEVYEHYQTNSSMRRYYTEMVDFVEGIRSEIRSYYEYRPYAAY